MCLCLCGTCLHIYVCLCVYVWGLNGVCLWCVWYGLLRVWGGMCVVRRSMWAHMCGVVWVCTCDMCIWCVYVEVGLHMWVGVCGVFMWRRDACVWGCVYVKPPCTSVCTASNTVVSERGVLTWGRRDYSTPPPTVYRPQRRRAAPARLLQGMPINVAPDSGARLNCLRYRRPAVTNGACAH